MVRRAVTQVLDCRLVPLYAVVGVEVLKVEGYLDKQPWFMFTRSR